MQKPRRSSNALRNFAGCLALPDLRLPGRQE